MNLLRNHMAMLLAGAAFCIPAGAFAQAVPVTSDPAVAPPRVERREAAAREERAVRRDGDRVREEDRPFRARQRRDERSCM